MILFSFRIRIPQIAPNKQPSCSYCGALVVDESCLTDIPMESAMYSRPWPIEVTTAVLQHQACSTQSHHLHCRDIYCTCIRPKYDRCTLTAVLSPPTGEMLYQLTTDLHQQEHQSQLDPLRSYRQTVYYVCISILLAALNYIKNVSVSRPGKWSNSLPCISLRRTASGLGSEA